MEAWTWLVAYLVGFALLQLFLYRYFQRGESTHDGEAREAGFQRLEQAAATSDAGMDDADGETVYCQHCGASNARDGMFSYCRNCAEPLR